ncbi:DUF1211 domain-containing protein [Jannaschia sp. Os4]|uniref:TMEM175 family protein n=1 Tax=Jannaschia sp. Os4 TaxID=2807617 RepID=UPI001939CEDD|nr:TMEM175 family protein [Jannaschia sp. Os4]MBM2576843.1 DUF1211 domain-containing protein [Jannaschia sp. Os4]
MSDQPASPTTDRLAAFADAVIAIVITIMVLDLEPPEGETIVEVLRLGGGFPAYALSFFYLALHWVNFHHLFAASNRLTAGIMWATMGYLFWLSLVPFATAWLGSTGFAREPAAIYGLVLLLAGVAHRLLEGLVRRAAPAGSVVRRELSRDWKGWSSVAGYVAGIALSLVAPVAGCAVYLAVGVAWLVPDPRLRRAMDARGRPG